MSVERIILNPLPRLVLLVLVTACTGCATRIVPPAKVSNPVTVFVTDYGRHSSILLPTYDGHLVEYTYGDWDYYALNKWRWYNGATALFYSEGAGLGRRVLPYPPDEEQLKRAIDSKRVLKLELEQSKVFGLLAELDQRYSRQIQSLIYNDSISTYFVRDDAHYSLFHTCNAETADWLQKLGCKVEGWAVLSNFEVDASEKRVKDEPAPAPSMAIDPLPLAKAPRTLTEPVKLVQGHKDARQ